VELSCYLALSFYRSCYEEDGLASSNVVLGHFIEKLEHHLFF
jgi:hypothetical protein